MPKADGRKVTPDELRRIALRTREPERERKMLALADELEEIQSNERGREDATREPN